MTFWNHDKLAFGGDYNPEQWDESVWQEDMRLFRLAHIDTVTLNVFSWAALQPSEDVYDFSRLDKIISLAEENGLKIVLATSTGAHPAWMAKKYPEILRTDGTGMKRKFGARHNSCPNSPVYRKFSAALAGRLAQRYGSHDSVIAWHVSNEYGGECYCEKCEAAFRVWLRKKYGTLQALNKAWDTAFWGHTFYDWDEIVLPDERSENYTLYGKERTAFQGIALDYKRFNSDSILDCFRLEYDAIRQYDKSTPITTNFMNFYYGLDYKKWSEHMDFVSWDNYPMPEDTPTDTAMAHDLMRGLRHMPFCLMESTPSVTNWQPVNKLKKPGEMRLLSYQAVAHGADSVMYFQMRRSIGASEKYHGAVIDHAGHENTRVFREVTRLGEELDRLGGELLGTHTSPEAAIVFDWDNWWATELSSGPTILLSYREEAARYYRALHRKNIPCEIIGIEDDLSGYKLVIAPVLYMLKPGHAERLKKFVENGGCLAVTYFSGYVNETDLVTGAYPGELRDLLGVWVEESDTLLQTESNTVVMKDGTERTFASRIMCDIIRPEGAETIAEYGDDFYAGSPVITRNAYGAGSAWYIGTSGDAELYDHLVGKLCAQQGIKSLMEPTDGVEVTRRSSDSRDYIFILNHNSQSAPLTVAWDCEDMLTGRKFSRGETVSVGAKDLMILRLPEKAKKKQTSIAFTGDIGFDRYMYGKWDDDELISEDILNFLRGADHVVANVEGPLLEQEQNTVKGGAQQLLHTIDPAAVKVLNNIRADIWSIVNNHIMDAGAQGVESTLSYARVNGAATIGAGMDINEARKPVILDEAGGIGIFGVGYQRACRKADEHKAGCFSWSDMDAIRCVIDGIKQTCRWCVMVVHGGEEFTALPSPYVRDRFHEFLRMGADAVVCHHPHVPLNYETVGEKIIFYSLGNFIFDTDYQRSQYNTEKGVLIKLRFTEKKMTWEPMGIELERGSEHIKQAPLPLIFEDVQPDQYELLEPLAAKMFVLNTKRQMTYLYPERFAGADERQWAEHFAEPLRTGRVPGEVLDFAIICPLAEKEAEKAWESSTLENVKRYILEQFNDRS